MTRCISLYRSRPVDRDTIDEANYHTCLQSMQHCKWRIWTPQYVQTQLRRNQETKPGKYPFLGCESSDTCTLSDGPDDGMGGGVSDGCRGGDSDEGSRGGKCVLI